VASRILIIQGHPDPRGGHFAQALAQAYATGAAAAGSEVRTIDIASLDFPLVRAQTDWERGNPPEPIRCAQETIRWADHLVILYPLWLGSMPALLKAFFEQVMRPGFAVAMDLPAVWGRLLKGRSGRVIVTMGMPAFVYRWFFFAHSLRSLERNLLRFVGIAPVRHTIIGSVDACGAAARARWLKAIEALGRAGR
jgi:putative NADPH-quinone reductase